MDVPHEECRRCFRGIRGALGLVSTIVAAKCHLRCYKVTLSLLQRVAVVAQLKTHPSLLHMKSCSAIVGGRLCYRLWPRCCKRHTTMLPWAEPRLILLHTLFFLLHLISSNATVFFLCFFNLPPKEVAESRNFLLRTKHFVSFTEASVREEIGYATITQKSYYKKNAFFLHKSICGI